MSLGINTQASGDFVPYIKYDARAGRIFRAKNRDTNEQNDVDITNGFTALFDLETIEVGWIHFPPSAAPDYVVQSVSLGLPERPAGEHRQGFLMQLMLASNPTVYEISSTSKATVESFNVLHDQYLAAPQRAEGKLPIVQLKETLIVETPSKAGTTRNYQPVWQIVGWAARPAALAIDALKIRSDAARKAREAKGAAKTQAGFTTPPATAQQTTPPATGGQAWGAPPPASGSNAPTFG